MGEPKPTGEYVDQMLAGGGWPDIDEDSLSDRAETWRRKLGEVNGVSQEWNTQQRRLFGSGAAGAGDSSEAANGAVVKNIASMQQVQDQLVNAITWYNHVAGIVTEVKKQIADYVSEAQAAVQTIKSTPGMKPEERDAAIEAIIQTVNGVNRSVVSSAVAFTSFGNWKPSADALDQLLKVPAPAGNSPPDAVNPGNAVPGRSGPRIERVGRIAGSRPASTGHLPSGPMTLPRAGEIPAPP